ncbi:MAG: hypothetical protein Q9160_000624 [Pyrenula sp. 1 TL-2023]
MSTPGASQPPEGEKAEGFAKVMKRVRTVLKRGRTKRASTTGAGEVAKPTSKPDPSGTAERTSVLKPASEEQPKSALQQGTSTGPTRKIDPRSLEQREKAKRMFAKHGLTLEDHEWTISPREPAERVEKAIRMRVRYTCHRCQATFVAGNKMCTNCSHHRCKGCDRFPPRKSKDKKPAAAATAPEPVALPPKPPKRRYDPLLTMPSRRGGQDLVRKPIKQRCQHVRCTECPRDPPKLKKYPTGYPGDVPASSDEKQITRPPNDEPPEPNPEVLKNVQEKLDALNVGIEEPGGSKEGAASTS